MFVDGLRPYVHVINRSFLKRIKDSQASKFNSALLVLYLGTLKEKKTLCFQDHSQSGQKQIDYRNTVYGNEVFRGCFRDIPTNRTLAIAIASTSVTKSKMTPDYCKQLCRSTTIFVYFRH